jgi:hypothetical protein
MIYLLSFRCTKYFPFLIKDLGVCGLAGYRYLVVKFTTMKTLSEWLIVVGLGVRDKNDIGKL